jgi:hypothetical protein
LKTLLTQLVLLSTGLTALFGQTLEPETNRPDFVLFTVGDLDSESLLQPAEESKSNVWFCSATNPRRVTRIARSRYRPKFRASNGRNFVLQAEIGEQGAYPTLVIEQWQVAPNRDQRFLTFHQRQSEWRLANVPGYKGSWALSDLNDESNFLWLHWFTDPKAWQESVTSPALKQLEDADLASWSRRPSEVVLAVGCGPSTPPPPAAATPPTKSKTEKKSKKKK